MRLYVLYQREKSYFMKHLSILICVVALLAVSSPVSAQSDGTQREDRVLEFADGLFVRGMYDSAIAEYERIRNAYSLSAELQQKINFNSAHAYFKKGDYANAETALLQCDRSYPAELYQHAQLLLGMIYSETQNYQEAVRIFSALMQEQLSADQYAMASYYYGTALMNTGDVNNAAAVFSQVQDTGQVQLRARALRDMAVIYEQQGDSANARAVLETFVADYPNHADSAAIYLTLGKMYFESGDSEHAFNAFASALPAVKDAQERGAAVYGAMKSAFALGRWQDAINAFGSLQAGDCTPELYAEMVFVYASALYESGDYAAAEQAVATVVQDPANAFYEQALTLSLWIAVGRKDVQGFEQLFIRFVGQFPDGENTAEAYFLKGQLLYDQQRWQDAAECYSIATDNQTFRYGDLARYQYGSCLKRLGDPAQALTVFQELVKQFPNSVYAERAVLECIELADQAGQPEVGLQYAQYYSDQYPDGASREDVLLGKARLEHQAGTADAMRDTLLAVVEQYPGSARACEALYNVGLYYEKQNDHQTAIAYYQKARDAVVSGSAMDATDIDLRMAAVYQLAEDPDSSAVIVRRIFSGPRRDRIPVDMLLVFGEYCGDRGEYATAQAVFDQAKALSQDQKVLERVLYKQADWFMVQGSTDKALTIFRNFLTQFPGSQLQLFVKLGVAQCELKRGNTAEARVLFDELSKIEVPYIKARAYAGLGDIDYKQGRKEEAVRSYMYVTVLFDDEIVPELMVQSARIFIELQKMGDAQAVIADFEKRFPDHPLMGKITDLKKKCSS